MSTKSSIILTHDNNEHWYEETMSEHKDDDGNHTGYSIIVELSHESVELIEDDGEHFFFRLKPGTEMYEIIKATKGIDEYLARK